MKRSICHYRTVAVILCVFLGGCGGVERPTTVPVQGQVTFAGGPCPAPGTVFFGPLEVPEGLPRRPGRGRFDTDGAFTVQSFTPGDGLVPGRYRTRLVCWKVPPSPSSAGVSYLPPGYQAPELVVEPNGPVEVRYDVPSAAR